jgi:hypothetical protein
LTLMSERQALFRATAAESFHSIPDRHPIHTRHYLIKR